MKHCFHHPKRIVFAFCDQCGKPCCDDCTLAVFNDYFCDNCKNRMAKDIDEAAVQPDALRAALFAGGGLFAVGFLLGPWAIFRTRVATALLTRCPWFRGAWHVKAAWVLGVLAVMQGVVWLLGLTLFKP